jgi:hypothetical protein
VYTSAEILTIVAAIGVLVASVGTVIVNIIGAARIEKKTDQVAAAVQEVHTLTNSNLSAVKAELATAVAQISILREMVGDLKAERERGPGRDKGRS